MANGTRACGIFAQSTSAMQTVYCMAGKANHKNLISMDKKSLKQNIENAFANFKAAINQHQDINIKRADGGWSVGEIAGHIVKSTGVNFGATQNTDRRYDQHAAAVKELFLNFQVKFPANPMLHPDAKQYSSDELFSSINKNLEAVLKMIDNDDLTRTCIDIALPVWGTLTKYEWLILMENHIIRHTHQVADFNK
jgi:hypothetical protein